VSGQGAARAAGLAQCAGSLHEVMSDERLRLEDKGAYCVLLAARRPLTCRELAAAGADPVREVGRALMRLCLTGYVFAQRDEQDGRVRYRPQRDETRPARMVRAL